jgi:hypothetical protein
MNGGTTPTLAARTRVARYALACALVLAGALWLLTGTPRVCPEEIPASGVAVALVVPPGVDIGGDDTAAALGAGRRGSGVRVRCHVRPVRARRQGRGVWTCQRRGGTMTAMTRTLPPPKPEDVTKVLLRVLDEAVQRSNIRFMVTPKLEDPPASRVRRPRKARAARGDA